MPLRARSACGVILTCIALGFTGCAAHSGQPASPPRTAAQPPQWDYGSGTTGAQLLFENPRATTKNGRPVVLYSPRAVGVPQDRTYALWEKWLDGKTGLLGQFRVTDAGSLVTIQGQLLGDMAFYSMFAGEPLEFALISNETNQSTKTFVRIIPFPLKAAGAGGCRLAMELISPYAASVAFRADGFQPNEEVMTVSKSGPEVLEGKAAASADGGFLMIILPGVVGSRGGPASFEAQGSSCRVTITYNWGTAMKVR